MKFTGVIEGVAVVAVIAWPNSLSDFHPRGVRDLKVRATLTGFACAACDRCCGQRYHPTLGPALFFNFLLLVLDVSSAR